jgi:carbon storage regulator
MLVLSRKKNETIIIDDQIRVTVVEIVGNRIRLGIEAPKEVLIRRSELDARQRALVTV